MKALCWDKILKREIFQNLVIFCWLLKYHDYKISVGMHVFYRKRGPEEDGENNIKVNF